MTSGRALKYLLNSFTISSIKLFLRRKSFARFLSLTKLHFGEDIVYSTMWTRLITSRIQSNETCTLHKVPFSS